LRYATIQTPEKFYLTWKEDSDIENPLDRGLTQLCGKERFLELIHQFKLAKKPVQCLKIYCCSRAGTSLGKTS
jgi:type I restriction enzyme R subunit